MMATMPLAQQTSLMNSFAHLIFCSSVNSVGKENSTSRYTWESLRVSEASKTSDSFCKEDCREVLHSSEISEIHGGASLGSKISTWLTNPLSV